MKDSSICYHRMKIYLSKEKNIDGWFISINEGIVYVEHWTLLFSLILKSKMTIGVFVNV